MTTGSFSLKLISGSDRDHFLFQDPRVKYSFDKFPQSLQFDFLLPAFRIIFFPVFRIFFFLLSGLEMVIQ